jgi:hypothetical protein
VTPAQPAEVTGLEVGALCNNTTSERLSRIAIHIAGPFPTSERGNWYLLVAMDFTKWPEVYAIPNHEAATVADALVANLFCRFGIPRQLHSDQGRNFEY